MERPISAIGFARASIGRAMPSSVLRRRSAPGCRSGSIEPSMVMPEALGTFPVSVSIRSAVARSGCPGALVSLISPGRLLEVHGTFPVTASTRSAAARSGCPGAEMFLPGRGRPDARRRCPLRNGRRCVPRRAAPSARPRWIGSRGALPRRFLREREGTRAARQRRIRIRKKSGNRSGVGWFFGRWRSRWSSAVGPARAAPAAFPGFVVSQRLPWLTVLREVGGR